MIPPEAETVAAIAQEGAASQAKRPPRVMNVQQADMDHVVVTTAGETPAYRRRPCKTCPWRKDQVGVFPAEAFRLSADTAYDLSQKVFSCHTNGTQKRALCAGFLLRGAQHNLQVRLGRLTGEGYGDVDVGGHALHDSYRDMAVANGVNESDPTLKPCCG